MGGVHPLSVEVASSLSFPTLGDEVLRSTWGKDHLGSKAGGTNQLVEVRGGLATGDHLEPCHEEVEWQR